jgi:EmrB/QacA subfamily drug resistance transporter
MAIAGVPEVPAQRGGPGPPAGAAGGAARDGQRPGGDGPARPGLVLAALIVVAVVANLNLTVATVALPAIGRDFDAAQTAIDLIAVGYSLGLAASVLYLGALGDRYGRKLMLILGNVLAIPASLLAAYSPDIGVLVMARLLGGLAAGLAYPTTLALITALWRGQRRTHAIALWSAIGGACSSLGPLIAGALLVGLWWGSVFLVTLPLAVVALVMVIWFVPSGVNETTGRVDNLGGVLSVLLVAALVLAINFAPDPGRGVSALALLALACLAGAAFVVRQRRARRPLYDLRVASRRVFWVAALAGIIVFGALMGALFVGQQYLQDVLGYSALAAGLAIVPAAVCMVLVAPHSARLVHARGSRFTLLAGYAPCLLGFVVMITCWRQGTPYWLIAVPYALVGIGVGLAGTPASHSLTGSVPVTRAGMASGTADLQRDLGGAIMQSLLGALLTAGYASEFRATIASAPHRQQISATIQDQLEKSFTGAATVAQRYPQYASKITAAAKAAFLAGDLWAYAAGMTAVVLGAVVVFCCFPGRQRELELLASYQAQDRRPSPADAQAPSAPVAAPGAAAPSESGPNRTLVR